MPFVEEWGITHEPGNGTLLDGGPYRTRKRVTHHPSRTFDFKHCCMPAVPIITFVSDYGFVLITKENRT